MPIKQFNRSRLNRIFGQVRLELQASPQAAESAHHRAGMTRSELIEVVRNSDAIVLPYTDGLHTYHLFYWPRCERFYIAEVTTNPTVYENGTPQIVDILSIGEFELSGGEVSRRFLRMAAGRALDKVTFRAWEEKTFGSEPKIHHVRVITYVENDRGEKESFVFLSAPVCQRYIELFGLENAFGHPGFPEWYRRRAIQFGVDIERVVALRIADTDALKLRLDAPQRECPGCRLNLVPREKNTDGADQSSDTGEDAAPVSPIKRLIARVLDSLSSDVS